MENADTGYLLCPIMSMNFECTPLFSRLGTLKIGLQFFCLSLNWPSALSNWARWSAPVSGDNPDAYLVVLGESARCPNCQPRVADLLVRNSDAAYVPRVSMAIFQDRILAESAAGHGRDDDRFWADLTGHETTGHRRLYDVKIFLSLLTLTTGACSRTSGTLIGVNALARKKVLLLGLFTAMPTLPRALLPRGSSPPSPDTACPHACKSSVHR